MISSPLSVLAAIGLLLILIIVHEAGHFFAARYFGMQTPVVGLGVPFFGPTWIIAKYKDIEFRFHPLLIGAYVAIPEMGDETEDTEDMGITLTRPKRSFPAWQRLIVSFAGPGANLVFALFLALMTVIFIGVPQKADQNSFFISQIAPQATVEVRSKLKAGDQILALNGETTKNELEFISKIRKLPNKTVELRLQRTNLKSEKEYCITEKVKTNKEGRLNIGLSADLHYGPIKGGIPIIEHLKWAWSYFAGWMALCTQGLWFLLSAPFRPDFGGVKLGDVHGVISATGLMAKSLQNNLSSGLQWGALFSIEIAIFNLLPLLPLDGGHILFQLIEIITGKKDSKTLLKVRDYVSQFGLVLVLSLTVLILFNDLRDIIFKK
jgi:membrane-associated protease RseP (regulator of RpoE activity)